MYVKRYVLRRGDKRYAYLRLVESYRDEAGKVRHRVLVNLGREEELKASGQLEQLAGTFARLDPPMLGVRREVGPLLLVQHYLERLGIPAIVERHAPSRGRARLSIAEVVSALIANRLCAPSPLYDVAAWAEQSAMHEIFGIPGMLLNDDRLGRALEDFQAVAEQVRGAVALSAIERFGVDAGRLHLDLTTLRVQGAYEGSSLVTKGWGPDRTVARQVRALAATNPDGVPLYIRPHPGNAAELTCVGEALERLGALLPPGLLVCADSAYGHPKNLCAAARAGLRFVVPLREASEFRSRFLAEGGHESLRPIRYAARRDRHLPTSRRTRYRGMVRPLDIADADSGTIHRFRVAYIHSSEEAMSVAGGRERALVKAETALAKVRGGLGGRFYRTPADVRARMGAIITPSIKDLLWVTIGGEDGKPTLDFGRNDDAVTEAAKTDGIYALATNLPGSDLTAGQVLRTYKQQSLVEVAHRDLKSSLRVRPVFLHNDDRIEALISVVGLALVVFGLIQADLRRVLGADERLPGLLPEGRSARPTGRNVLAAFQGLGLTYTREGIVLDRMTHTQRRILELLGVPVPWPEQGK